MKPIILFDLDGTLIDSTEAILESFHHTLTVCGSVSNVSNEMITSQIGHPLETMFSGVGVAVTEVDKHVETYKLYYREIACQKTVMLPGAIEAVEEAARFAKLGIVTTKTGKYSRELLEYFGIMDRFEILIGREDVEYPKPHPEPILKAIAHFHPSHSEIWMIGDTRLDIEASISAGVKSVAVTSGYDNEEQLLTLTDVIKCDVLEAVRYIANWG